MKSIRLMITALTLVCIAGCASSDKNPLEHRLVLQPGSGEVIRVKSNVNAIMLDNESIGDVTVSVVDRDRAVQSLIVEGREKLALRAESTRELRIHNPGRAKIRLRVSMKEETIEMLGWTNVW
jgi:hypothetical protein